jgi:DNA invertase Pin-like site-specific DNA recombinase
VTRFVVYLRVSTARQGASGLGIEAQREAVARHVAGAGGRIVAEVVGLIETGVPFVAANMPNATPFMLHVYAAMAEAEGKAISARTKAALAAAKARGVRLGNPRLIAGNRDQACRAAAAKSAKASARASSP